MIFRCLWKIFKFMMKCNRQHLQILTLEKLRAATAWHVFSAETAVENELIISTLHLGMERGNLWTALATSLIWVFLLCKCEISSAEILYIFLHWIFAFKTGSWPAFKNNALRCHILLGVYAETPLWAHWPAEGNIADLIRGGGGGVRLHPLGRWSQRKHLDICHLTISSIMHGACGKPVTTSLALTTAAEWKVKSVGHTRQRMQIKRHGPFTGQSSQQTAEQTAA